MAPDLSVLAPEDRGGIWLRVLSFCSSARTVDRVTCLPVFIRYWGYAFGQLRAAIIGMVLSEVKNWFLVGDACCCAHSELACP